MSKATVTFTPDGDILHVSVGNCWKKRKKIAE